MHDYFCLGFRKLFKLLLSLISHEASLPFTNEGYWDICNKVDVSLSLIGENRLVLSYVGGKVGCPWPNNPLLPNIIQEQILAKNMYIVSKVINSCLHKPPNCHPVLAIRDVQ